MADMKTLCEEMKKLKRQIETVISVSEFGLCDDLSGLEDYKQIKTADDLQRLEEYRSILYKIEDIQRNLAYLERPVREVSLIYANESGRYETNKGYYFTSGSVIEFLRFEEVYNYDTNTWENAKIWTVSSVESESGRYYISGFKNVEMSGLTVRVRA